jgi:lipopolysaccharide export system protein LptA
MRRLIFFLLFLFPLSIWAETLPVGAITVKSDSMKYFGAEGKSVFSGKVVVTSDEYTLKAETLDVFFDKNNEINKITCSKNVNFQTEEIRATSNFAEIDQRTKIINLQGKAKLWQGANYLEGEKIRINYETKEIIADKGGTERVTVIFTPDNKTEGEEK